MGGMSINEQRQDGVPRWTITDRLRKAREDMGYTQQQLATAAEISLRTVSNYENPEYDKERKRPFIRAWAFATGVPLDWLLHGTVTGPDDTGGQEISPTRWYGAEVVDLRARRNAAPARAA